MIIGIGIDIIEIDRIKNIIKKWGHNFLDKVYTLDEKKYCEQKENNSFQSYAGYFAAKEAVAKALGTGIFSIKWTEIEIKKNIMGKPFVVLSGNAKKISKKKMITNINISISHNKEMAIAQAIIEN